jgi:cell division protein FtsL
MSAAILRQPLLALLIAALWFGVLGSAAGVIYVKHRARELFVELERANARRDTLEIEWGQLQLEQSAWSTHAFVERIAEAKLRMGMPPPQAIQILTQSAAPAPLPSPIRAPAGAAAAAPARAPAPASNATGLTSAFGAP